MFFPHYLRTARTPFIGSNISTRIASTFDCGSGDIYSLTIQKGEDDNEVMTLVVEDYTKKLLDQG
jgi:hypothetical protein